MFRIAPFHLFADLRICTAPECRQVAIRYHADKPPALAVRIQEMFGEATNPAVAEGRVPLVGSRLPVGTV
jgi:hypothetical protein